ncbi:hypothetical protein MMC19_006158 [Ptychographa xylographoides]|nr:hypothetical protein [Ptychographa xylographoides]
MKPRQRVVTAHDIENSLYYFHVNTAMDEDIRGALEETQGAFESDEPGMDCLARPGSSGQSPKRKPLPLTPGLALGDRPEPPPKMYPHFQVPHRKPVRATGRADVIRSMLDIAPELPPRERSVPTTPPSLPPRQLHGPRPLYPRHPPGYSATSYLGSYGDENLQPGRPSAQVPILLPRQDLGIDGAFRADRHGNISGHGSSLKSPNGDFGQKSDESLNEILPVKEDTSSFGEIDSTPHLSITVIRRDPSSSGQWNVGKITTGRPSVRRDSSQISLKAQPSKPDERLLLEISTGGYEKFCNTGLEELTTTSSEKDINTIQGKSVTSTLPKQSSFCRELFLERPKSRPKSLSPRRHGFKSSMDVERDGESSALSPSLCGSEYHLSAQTSSSHVRPLTFASPWDGTCEFSTGISGSSLKCKHTLHHPPGSPGHRASSPRTVSELRFNLPRSKGFSYVPPRRPRLSTGTPKRSSFLSSPRPQDGSFPDRTNLEPADTLAVDSSDDESDDRMDLSLGQEQAGGGFRGKEAKLGKLIVEDEGLKMLDLIVAANLGVWWKVYERGAG